MTHSQSTQTNPRAREYQRHRQKLSLFHLVLTPGILALMILWPISLQFREWALSLHLCESAAVAVYFLIFSLFMLVFDLPFSFYSGFLLEHRYGLSNQTLSAWTNEFVKKTILSFTLSLILLEGLYAIIWNFPARWWLIAWAAYVLVSYVLGKLFPVLIVPLFYKYGKLENEMLRKRILDLVARFKMPVENVYSLNLSKTTKKANAAFMGMGKTKRVVLSDTLIANFTDEEIETVVAHEIGHFKHGDIWKQLAFGSTISMFLFWLAFQTLTPLAARFHLEGPGNMASLPLLFLIFYTAGIFLTPLQSAFSRCLERAADRFALQQCVGRDVFISCMEKLGKINLSDPDPNPVYEWYFYDHPSISKRIHMAKHEKK